MNRLVGTYGRRVTDDEGNIEITFTVTDYQSKRETEKLKKGQDYLLTAAVPRSKRSLEQNNLLWELIGDICQVENGCRDEAEEMQIYCSILQMAGAKCDYFECTEEAYEAFKKQFRVCSVVQEREHNGTKTVMVKAYFGTSKMNTEEMNLVIEKAFEYAEKVGINTDYWEAEFGL